MGFIPNNNSRVNYITVLDPYADLNEAKNSYNINLEDITQINNMDTVILGVAHNQYISMRKEEWKNILNEKGVFIDVKSIYPKDFFTGENILHWRL